jgi:hypothetical protein
MSRGPGTIERRIAELLDGITRECRDRSIQDGKHVDRVLSVDDICDYAFSLKGKPASRAQRLSATRAAHRSLTRAAATLATLQATIQRMMRETEAALGRPPYNRRDVYFNNGDGGYVAVDQKFADAMETAPSWPAWQQSCAASDRLIVDWRETQTADRRLWFHLKHRPVRVWAVSVQPAGVIWADTELVRVTERNVMVRYAGEIARLDRGKLCRWWAFWRGVMFVSSRTGRIAARLDELWQRRYGANFAGAPPVMQMPLAAALELLGLSGDYTKDDVLAAFRVAVKKAHPDVGGTAEQFRELVAARDRLLAALGTSAPAPKMPTYAPSGVAIRYGRVRLDTLAGRRIGQIRQLGL